MRSEGGAHGPGVEAKLFTPPLSGAVLGHIIDAFDLRRFDGDGSLSATNARRYLRGDRVSPEAEFEMHVAFAKAVVDAGLLPPGLTVANILGPDAGVPAEVPVTALLVPIVSQYAKHWDALAGTLRRLTAPVAFPGHATGACLRLLAIDLSVRLTALLWLARVTDERPLADFWTKPNGTGLWLRSMHDRCTPSLSRDKLAGAVRVHIKTLDGWLDHGVRPTHENLIDLANELAKRNVGEVADLLRKLRLAFGARRLFEEIEKVVGTSQALGICERTVGYANMMLAFPRSSTMAQSENDLKMRMVLTVGTLGRGQLAMKWVASMLNAMWLQDPNPVWRTSLRAVTGSWFGHLQDVTAKLGPIDADGWQELAASLGHEPTEDDLYRIAYSVQATKEQCGHVPGMADVMDSEILEGGEAAALELKIRATEVANGGDPVAAIEMLRAALREAPLDSEVHFRLGCHLWTVGDANGGIAELDIAIHLRPTWDRPRVEIAIILLNTGRDEEAIERLLASRAALGGESAWLLFHLAYSYERVSNPAEAIAAYEELLRLEPENGEALDRLAHLYLAMGDRRKGADRAKQAAHLGIPTVLHAFKKGYYDKKPPPPPPNERPPHLMSRDLVQFPDDAWPRRR